MPFSEQFKNTYNLAIKPAVDEAGAFCQRVDEMIFTENMMEKIYNEINKSDLMIADLSMKNPNVFYELGYAHALNKKVILLTTDANDIPFDLKQYQHFIYQMDDILKLKESLVGPLSYYLNNLKHSEMVTIPYKIMINDIELKNEGTYQIKHNKHRTQNAFFIEFMIKNDRLMYQEIAPNKVLLEIDNKIIDPTFMTDVNTENDNVIFSLGSLPSLFPQENVKLQVSIAYKNYGTMMMYFAKRYKATLKILFPTTVEEMEFYIELRE